MMHGFAPAPPSNDRALSPVRSTWRRVDGLRMHARVSAAPVPERRPPVVLVHGFIVSSRYMTPLIERLGRDFKVLAPDLPGFGQSDKPKRVLNIGELADALDAWMTAMGIRRAALFANSLGCQIAVDLAWRRPARVLALVLQGPTVDPDARTGRESFLRMMINSSREVGVGIGPVLDYLQAGLRRAFVTGRYMLQDPVEHKLPRIAQPTLVIRGARDPIAPQGWAEEVTRRLPRGRLRVIPGGAHTMVTLAPLELSRVARPFLLEAARAAPHRMETAR